MNGVRMRISTKVAFSSTDHGFVLGAGLPPLDEERLLRRGVETIVNHPRQVAKAGGGAGFRIPRIDQGAPLALADEGSGALEAVELALDGIQRHRKLPGDGPAVGLPVMEQRKKYPFRRLSAKEILERRRDHDRRIQSKNAHPIGRRVRKRNFGAMWHLEGTEILMCAEATPFLRIMLPRMKTWGLAG